MTCVNTAVLGAGSWGTALASVLAENGHRCVLWARREEVARDIRIRHQNPRYLPDAVLPSSLMATSDLDRALDGADLVLFVVPSTSMPELVRAVAPKLGTRALVCHAVKGFERQTGRRMSELLADALPGGEGRIAVVTGPSHAEEVVRRLPTTLVAASTCRATAEQVQDALMNPYLRVYTNPDVVGVELGGSLKNIIALAVGVADGLGFGDNAKAALITRGLAEIARLGSQLGAYPLTFAGLSGVGDLIVTCTSRHSRNLRAGRLIGQGLGVQEALAQVGMAVEGVPTTDAAYRLARRHQVEMPITEALWHVLFQGASPTGAVEALMGRERGHEMEEVAKELTPSWRS
ncbi:MAG: NAD(P)H-dependent glycerol-3-phosphate dehydrogenase [Alicyclobacillus sp.]|nr:NAD(P)H-dependent glycerol-3-phosphate dehydrogenase [Alicyclobacillus sp.]